MLLWKLAKRIKLHIGEKSVQSFLDPLEVSLQGSIDVALFVYWCDQEKFVREL